MINYSKFDTAYEDLENEDIIEIIEVFLNSSKLKLQQIHHALDQADYDKLEKDAHQMKGSLVHFFDEDARALGEQLEYYARMKEPIEKCVPVLEALEKNIFQLSKELKSIINQLNR